MKKMISPFLVFISLSWILELVGGWVALSWWWGSTWFLLGVSGGQSLASFLSFVIPMWTVEGIFHGLFSFFVVIHLLFALVGLLWPRYRSWRLGARAPVLAEKERFSDAFQVIVWSIIPGGRPLCPHWLVVDGPGRDMYWHGYTLVVDRELFADRFFVPLLAAQIGQLDERLERTLYSMLPSPLLCLGVFFGWPIGIGHLLLYPLWMRYWRQKVFQADAFAVQVGQGYGLIRALRTLYLPMDVGTKGGRFLRSVPFVAERIAAIEQLQRSQISPSPRII